MHSVNEYLHDGDIHYKKFVDKERKKERKKQINK